MTEQNYDERYSRETERSCSGTGLKCWHQHSHSPSVTHHTSTLETRSSLRVHLHLCRRARTRTHTHTQVSSAVQFTSRDDFDSSSAPLAFVLKSALHRSCNFCFQLYFWVKWLFNNNNKKVDCIVKRVSVVQKTECCLHEWVIELFTQPICSRFKIN